VQQRLEAHTAWSNQLLQRDTKRRVDFVGAGDQVSAVVKPLASDVTPEAETWCCATLNAI